MSVDESEGERLPVIGPAPTVPGLLVAEIGSAAAKAKASWASSTQRVYASDWRLFVAWCDARAIESLPADPRAVATFLAAEADRGAKPAPSVEGSPRSATTTSRPGCSRPRRARARR